MIKSLLKLLFINLAGIFISLQLSQVAVAFYGDLFTLMLLTLVISVGNTIVRPIINLLLLPIHLITLGLFRWVANLVVVYLVTLLIPSLKIHGFISTAVNLKYLIIPSINFSVFGSFLFFTFIISVVFHFLYWLFRE